MQSIEVSLGSIHGLPNGAEDFLSPAEAEHYSQLRFAARRQSYLLGRLAGKLLLLQHPEFASLQPWEITIANGPLGMPIAFVHGEVIDGAISLSHSGEMGLSAYTTVPGFMLGVDVEMLTPRSAGLVQDFFTNREAELITAQTPEEQTEWINRLWSAKEAVLKALGIGLRIDTRQVEVMQGNAPKSIDGWQPLLVQSSLFKAGACQVFSCKEEGFVLSLAVLSQAEYLETFQINLRKMLLEIPLELSEVKE